MNKIPLKNLLFLTLAVFFVGIILSYLLLLQKHQKLLKTAAKIQEQTIVLEKEKQTLLQGLAEETSLRHKLSEENVILKDYLNSSREKVAELSAEAQDKQKRIDDLGYQFFLLKLENTALREEKERISKEKESSDTRMMSLAELKKAISGLRKRLQKKVNNQTEGTVFLVNNPSEGPEKKAVLVEGNRGFVIRDGKFVNPARVKIEVVPAVKK